MTVYDAPIIYDSGVITYGGFIVIPEPAPQIPVAAPADITYLFTDLNGSAIAELPCNAPAWSKALNGAGQWSATLDVEDSRVAKLDWIAATDPYLTMVWVDIDGTLEWGGIIDHQEYSDSESQDGVVQLTATDPIGYLSRRLQAKDYSTTWSTTAAGAEAIGYTLITDALAVANSFGVDVAVTGTVPSQYQMTLMMPISQRQSVGALIGQLQALGYLVGFDYACDYQYVSGVPTCTISLSYPRRGRVAGTTGLEIDLAARAALRWPKDATQHAVRVEEMATQSGGSNLDDTWEPAMAVDGYPLTEKVVSHNSFAGSTTPQTVLQAYAADDLAISAYPVIAPQVTLPMFADPVIGEYIVGDDVAVVSAPRAGRLPPACPRFPNGLDIYLRIIKTDHSVPDEGVPTTSFTLAMPPTTTPQKPPQ